MYHSVVKVWVINQTKLLLFFKKSFLVGLLVSNILAVIFFFYGCSEDLKVVLENHKN